MTSSDGDVIERVRSGDTEAFGTLVERYHGRCMRYALHMIGDESVAQDLVQDAFLRAFRALDSYDHEGRFDRWLLSIVANRARTEAVRRSRNRGRTVGLDALGSRSTEAGPLRDPLLRRRLHDALGKLQPALREAVLLYYVEDMTYAEMADLTGAGESALKMRVSRARRALREMLKGLAAP